MYVCVYAYIYIYIYVYIHMYQAGQRVGSAKVEVGLYNNRQQ